MFFGYFYPAPPILGYLYCVFNPFLPSKIIVNITGDEKGSILIFLVLGFLHFWPFSLSPTNSGYFSRVLSPFLPSKIIVNIIGDEYGSILIFTVFGFGLFLAVFGHF